MRNRVLAASAFPVLTLLVACSSSERVTRSVQSGPPSTAPTARRASTSGSVTPSTTAPPVSAATVLPRTGGAGRSSLAFEAFRSCDDFLAKVRAIAVERVTAYGLGSGPVIYDVVPAGGPTMTFPASAASAGAASRARGAAAAAPAATPADQAGSSGTNTQEVGVDEGDLVDNDGRYVYSVLDGVLRVVDTTTGDQAVVDTAQNGAQQLLLVGHHLVTVTSGWNVTGPLASVRPIDELATTGQSSTISVYDVSTPMHAELSERKLFEGQVLAARATGNVVRIVVASPLGAQIDFVMPARQNESAIDKAKKANIDAINSSTVDQWLPRVIDVDAGGKASKPAAALSCLDVGAPSTFAGLGLTWLASIDLGASTDVVGSAGVVAQGAIVYASTDTLYVATSTWFDQQPDPDLIRKRQEINTAIHEFALGSGVSARYIASGEVPGVLLNSFAMSELNGSLRVATTEQPAQFGPATSSTVSVLRRDGDALDVIGSVGGLGNGEQIYAVRFLGSAAYVVTFRQTDPLFVVDLRDERNPRVAGELKVPGYSAYLHPIGDGLLLGVGQDAGTSGRVTGLQVSLFDVNDPAHPKRLANVDLGGNSAAEWDHHAFLWWPAGDGASSGTVVVPTTDFGSSYNASGVPNAPQIGVTVLDVHDGTIGERGRVDGPCQCGVVRNDMPSGIGIYAPPVQRALIVAGKLVTGSEVGLRVSNLATLDSERMVAFDH